MWLAIDVGTTYKTRASQQEKPESHMQKRKHNHPHISRHNCPIKFQNARHTMHPSPNYVMLARDKLSEQ